MPTYAIGYMSTLKQSSDPGHAAESQIRKQTSILRDLEVPVPRQLLVVMFL
jgi:hypothetical protein